ncbi:19207_t:CDS:2 [Funneliformis geosporum]|uniref:19207_t:CDS:1 n=1 Tax=Funneliformis geosporum TaxID=1117311 RepID=A0A9W4T7R3_9GLOM|nr:19207_t:CDS:2 [Funneliformis geosporum]
MSTSPLLPVVTVQYEKCFELVSYERWSINRYDFYFLIITTKQNKPQEIRDFVEELFNNKRSDTNSSSTLSQVSTTNPNMVCSVPVKEIPLRANGSIDILEVIKTATKVPTESVDDAELYQIFHNWRESWRRWELSLLLWFTNKE